MKCAVAGFASCPPLSIVSPPPTPATPAPATSNLGGVQVTVIHSNCHRDDDEDGGPGGGGDGGGGF